MLVYFLTRERKCVNLDGRRGEKDLEGVANGENISEYIV